MWIRSIIIATSLVLFSFGHAEKIGIITDSVGVDFYNFLGGRTFPVILQERLLPKNIWIINDSISATTTYTGPGRINEMIAHHWPQVIFIGLSANDIFRFMPVTDIQYNLELMFQIAEQFQVQVIMGKVNLKAYLGKDNFGCCSPAAYNPMYIEQIELMYKILEDKYPQVLFCPYLTIGLVNGPGMTYDFIHATLLGHEILADYTESAIISALKLRKMRWGL